MKKHAFLMPLAALAATLSNGGEAVAGFMKVDSAPANMGDVTPTKELTTENLVVTSNGDQFDFVLKKNGAGQMMAYHSSHRSHMSHSSHRSHFSSYN